MVEKHGRAKVEAQDIPYDDKRRMFVVLTQVNALFAKLYLTMPDETYRVVIDAVPDRPGAWHELRSTALVSLRQAEFPNSKYLDPKALRCYSYDVGSA